MTKFIATLFILSLFSCKQDNILYSGFNDLVVGSQKVILYDNNRYFLELSMGETEGDFKKSGDTILLFYDNKPSVNWPDTIILTKEHFELFDTNNNHGRTKIHRDK